MNKIEKFATEMSVLLYTMRAESNLIETFLQTPNTHVFVPNNFINKIVNDVEHIEKMKKIIYKDIVHHLTQSPDNFKNEKGEYKYQPDMYDFAFAFVVDNYIEQLYEDKHCTKTVWVCPDCGSDNVQTKMWVNVNTNKVDGQTMEDYDEYYCEDCKNYISKVSEAIMMPRKKVIGFQVVGIEDCKNEGNMHPDMEASFCIYSLSQAIDMITKPSGTGSNDNWKLLTIWTDDVEEPTFMFKGDLRK